MTPKIVKQKKIFLNQEKNEKPSFSRLEATVSAEIPMIVNLLFLQKVVQFKLISIYRTSLKTGMKIINKLGGMRLTIKIQRN